MVRAAFEKGAGVMLNGEPSGKEGSCQRQLVSLGELMNLEQAAVCSCKRDQ